MPTYEYRCTSCHHDFEKFQRMSDEPGAECPNCGKEAQRRLSAGAGLHFKGSGFYITDYRSESYKKAAGAEGGGSKKTSGTEGGDSGKAAGDKAKGGSGKEGGASKSETKSSSSKED